MAPLPTTNGPTTKGPTTKGPTATGPTDTEGSNKKSNRTIAFVKQCLLARNECSSTFFEQESPKLAVASQYMATCFQKGGKLVAFGKGPYATDAQHVSVEFVHPVIVGKKALPALDLSHVIDSDISKLIGPHDMVMGFAPPTGDTQVSEILQRLSDANIFTLALPGTLGGYAVSPPSDHPFIYQELIEILYHTLWETVHVFLEHQAMGHNVGATNFLYPFLSDQKQDTDTLLADVAISIREKAAEDEALRNQIVDTQAALLSQAAVSIAARLKKGGKILVFGNGGSATDANDFAADCMMPTRNLDNKTDNPVIPAISLSIEPAILSALANDVGAEVLFLRQLIAHQQSTDIALALSTSGNSNNIMATLAEAKKAGLLTVAILGCDGGEIARQNLADILITVPSNYIPRIQEIQASIYHTLIETLYQLLASGD